MSYQSIHRQIALWYQQHGRKELPWRNTEDSYHIYLSEIMLQQTQVKTVLERYYFPFLEQFPTLEALANAKLEEVLKAWQGLGYYQRARNLHNAAIAASPQLPTTIPELIKLPGIGKTTAHAIASFAYHTPVAILDANVKRILFRFFALKKRDEKVLWQKAETLLDTKAPYNYNQAMMDIGATICTPKAPLCQNCPLENACSGKADPLAFPEPKKRKKVPTKNRHYLIRTDGTHYEITMRNDRLLEGLWSFPEIEHIPEDSTYIGEIKHAYTHFKLEAKIYLQWSKINAGLLLQEIIKKPHSRVEEKILELLRAQPHRSVFQVEY